MKYSGGLYEIRSRTTPAAPSAGVAIIYLRHDRRNTAAVALNKFPALGVANNGGGRRRGKEGGGKVGEMNRE